ncbi:MAG: ribonuclease P protein component [Pseudomonadota bacterium]
MNQKLNKKNKIKKRNDFINIKKEGSKKRADNILLLFRKNEKNKARIGIIVTKKTGNAVIRNKWKRSIREIFRKKFKTKYIGYDLLFIVTRKKDEKETLSISQMVNKDMLKLLNA